MAANNFNTTTLSIGKLLENDSVYRVPMFQRDYSWTEQEWDDLWRDITGLMEPDGELVHYMGYLVLQSKDERNYEIIDGQQRITTLSLLILAVLKNLSALVESEIDTDNNRLRIETLRNSYIGYLDPVTLITHSKLTLNRHNDKYYQNYIVPLEKLPKRNLKASEKLLRKGFEWFEKKVEERFAEIRRGEELARFVKKVSDSLVFTVISVTDELNAFKVFETLNARGVRLSSTDLLKNYLFSVVHSASGHEFEIRELEERWESVVEKLGSENLPDFLRVCWNSRKSLARHKELFKKIRESITDKASVFALLRDLEEDADVYAALSDPQDTLWTSEQRKHIAELSMFNIRQPYPLLLSAHRVLEATDFTRVLRACSIISFRYNVIGNLATNEQERVYNSVAEKITKKEYGNSNEVIRALRPVYLTDEQFKNSFAEKELKTVYTRNNKIVRYILFMIEAQSNQNYEYDSDKYSIEHILPEHPDDNWSQFTDEQAERLVYRIGNMTLLETKLNREIGNKPYAEKLGVFRESCFSITSTIPEEHTEWTSERIASRQQWLAKQATAIWRLNELS